MVIFSGLHYPGYYPYANFNDVWYFDGFSWTNPFPDSPRPTPRRGAGAIYDAVNDRLVAFGGEYIYVFSTFLDAQVNIKPETLNLKSKGRWITSYITLPDGFDVEDIDLDIIVITKINQDWLYPPLMSDQDFGGEVGDYNNDMVPDLTIKFDRQELLNQSVPLGEIAITIGGMMTTGDFFGGTAMIYTIQSDLEKSFISGESVKPTIFDLHQNYPNPFNPSTLIKFDIPNSCNVRIDIYNSAGQNIRTLINENMPSGSHYVEFNAENLSSGIYYYRINAGEFQDVKKMILLK
jgi:hypothetical protein